MWCFAYYITSSAHIVSIKHLTQCAHSFLSPLYSVSLHMSISCEEIIYRMVSNAASIQALESCDCAICTCTVSIFPRHDNVIFPGWIKALLCYGVYLTAQCMPVNQCNMTWNIMPQSWIFVWKQPMILSGICLIYIIPFFPVALESVAYLPKASFSPGPWVVSQIDDRGRTRAPQGTLWCET